MIQPSVNFGASMLVLGTSLLGDANAQKYHSGENEREAKAKGLQEAQWLPMLVFGASALLARKAVKPDAFRFLDNFSFKKLPHKALGAGGLLLSPGLRRGQAPSFLQNNPDVFAMPRPVLHKKIIPVSGPRPVLPPLSAGPK
jgi:hypothetical protein